MAFPEPPPAHELSRPVARLPHHRRLPAKAWEIEVPEPLIGRRSIPTTPTSSRRFLEQLYPNVESRKRHLRTASPFEDYDYEIAACEAADSREGSPTKRPKYSKVKVTAIARKDCEGRVTVGNPLLLDVSNVRSQALNDTIVGLTERLAVTEGNFEDLKIEIAAEKAANAARDKRMDDLVAEKAANAARDKRMDDLVAGLADQNKAHVAAHATLSRTVADNRRTIATNRRRIEELENEQRDGRLAESYALLRDSKLSSCLAAFPQGHSDFNDTHQSFMTANGQAIANLQSELQLEFEIAREWIRTSLLGLADCNRAAHYLLVVLGRSQSGPQRLIGMLSGQFKRYFEGQGVTGPQFAALQAFFASNAQLRRDRNAGYHRPASAAERSLLLADIPDQHKTYLSDYFAARPDCFQG
jgi:hypothetical protein